MATIYVNEGFTEFDAKIEEGIVPETDIKTDVYESLQKTKDCELYQTINQEVDKKVISRKKILYILLIFLSAAVIGLIGVIILFASTTKTDGIWESWQMWSNCSTDCGGGFRTRSRTCSNPTPSHGGRYCQGNSIDTESCGNEYYDGSWESWQMWINCSADCGRGFRTRSRTCSNPTLSRCGRHCQGNSVDIESCENEACGYKLIVKEMNWTEAKDYCNVNGGQLATIKSLHKQMFLNDFLNQVEINDKRVWIGASDTLVEGTFVWIDGTTFSAFCIYLLGTRPAK
ncbi:SCO-spondin-like isoform X2 [Mercenaria mercenaria]|uniref:SCO-spondin-like isoform X2 n=1 Tax=Mercenaria mercenaria TaxID=6596 RepID=UPI00234E9E42|nr:SCO-spondin-like isoform X2 [Mercenaria mercenaria]